MWTDQTEYEEYHKLQLSIIRNHYSDISTITHSTKYRPIIVIEKIPKNIEISFFFNIAHPYARHKSKFVKWEIC